ncbi:hypothetical protein BDY21DRAFT_703 [Lineolata rhizophorae]|uniref:Homeobox domain-containing protein n=1 Tax=Lineolata rhizophorae TaxID=578093 RepID=A0A6A6PEE7_9PEZI|nr:hypothetical protein BDY21DRAFT_703 [Lineolata rhizophorae]
MDHANEVSQLVPFPNVQPPKRRDSEHWLSPVDQQMFSLKEMFPPGGTFKGFMKNLTPSRKDSNATSDGASAAMPKKNRRLGAEAKMQLREWFNAHASYPYPTKEEEASLMNSTGLSLQQLRRFFTNARARSSEKDKGGVLLVVPNVLTYAPYFRWGMAYALCPAVPNLANNSHR